MRLWLSSIVSAFSLIFAFGAAADTAREETTLGATRPVDEARKPDDARTKTLGSTRPAKAVAPAKPAPEQKASEITIVPVIRIQPQPTHAPQ